MKKNMYPSSFFAALLFFFGTGQAFAQPANDECSDAISIGPDDACTPVSGTFTSADPATTSSGAFISSCETDNFGDIWYTFTASTDDNYVINLTDIATTDPSVSFAVVDVTLYKGSCADLGIGAYDNCGSATYSSDGSGQDLAPITVSNASGVVFLLKITRDDAYDSDNNIITPTDMSFNLCVQHVVPPPPPANDECTGAVELSNSTYDGNNSGATQSMAESSCGSGGGTITDVWYKFTPLADGDASIDIAQNDGTNIDIVAEVFNGDCGSLSSIDCQDDDYPWSVPVISGETYYMRIYGYGGATGTFSITLNDIPMPVTLTSFTGEVLPVGNRLAWVTAMEDRASRFEIQQCGDGRSFKTIGSVNASGRAGGSQYQFEDANPLKGNNYYRLKMIDIDGGTAYSGIVMLQKENSNFSLQAGPNPAHDNLAINTVGERTGHARVQLFDLTGKLVMSRTIESDHSDIDISQLASGSYILQYRDDVYNVTQKISKY